MRAATIDKRARTWPPVAQPGVSAIGAVVTAGILGALGWWWPSAAAAVGLLLLVGCSLKITSLQRLVRALADHDSLTGAASRAHFLEVLVGALEEGHRSGCPVSVAVLDCDDFKRLNERFGHAIGDNVLIEVALTLQRRVSEHGTVGRIWGDAFGLVLPGMPLSAARTLIGEAQQALGHRMAQNDWPVTFSVGIASRGETPGEPSGAPEGAGSNGATTTAAELLAEADALMFSVKRRGRNGMACAGPPAPAPSIDEPAEQTSPEPVRSLSPELARQP